MNKEGLYELVKNFSQAEITYYVRNKLTIFSNTVEIYVPNNPYPKIRDGFKPNKKVFKDRNYIKKKTNPEDIERSIRRTKKSIKGYLKSNKFKLWATFTFKRDRFEVDKCKKKLSNWLKNQQKYGKFEYLAVPEFHKDKKALHFHVLIYGYKGKLKRSRKEKTGKLIFSNGREVFDFPGYRSGHTRVFKIGNKIEDQEKLANYTSKYITKDMPLISNKNRYWVSFGHKKPIVIENTNMPFDEKEPIRIYENEFGRILYYKKSQLKGLLP